MALFGHRWQIHRAALAIVDHLLRLAGRESSDFPELNAIRTEMEAWQTESVRRRVAAFLARIETGRSDGTIKAALAHEFETYASRLLELLDEA